MDVCFCNGLAAAPVVAAVAAVASGHGFKLAPVVGQMLADDALDLPPFDPLCSIDRYV